MFYTVLGLTLDIIGVFAIGIPIAFRSNAKMIEQATSHYGAPEEAPNTAVRERTSMWIGLGALIFGFGLQIVGALSVGYSAP